MSSTEPNRPPLFHLHHLSFLFYANTFTKTASPSCFPGSQHPAMTSRSNLIKRQGRSLWKGLSSISLYIASIDVSCHDHWHPCPALSSPAQRIQLALQSTVFLCALNYKIVSISWTHDGNASTKSTKTHGLLKLALIRRPICSRNNLITRSFRRSHVLTRILDRST